MASSNVSGPALLATKTTSVWKVLHAIDEVMRLRAHAMPAFRRGVVPQTFRSVDGTRLGERRFQKLDAIAQLVQLIRARFGLANPVRRLVLGIKYVKSTMGRARPTAGHTRTFGRRAARTPRCRSLRTNVDTLIWGFGLDTLPTW